MTFIKNNWILILILIILIVVIVRMKKSPATTQSEALNSGSGFLGGSSSIPPRQVIESVLPSSTGSTTGSGSSNTTPVTLQIGDEIYAKDSIVSAYRTPDATQTSNVVYYFKKDDNIGSFLAKEGNFYKVSIYQGLFAGYGNYYVIANQTYSK